MILLHFEVTCVITSFQCNFKHLSSVVCCKIENQVTNSAIDDTVGSKDEMRYATMGSTMDLKPSLLSFKRHLVLFNLFPSLPKYLHFHDFKINPFFLSVVLCNFLLKTFWIHIASTGRRQDITRCPKTGVRVAPKRRTNGLK